MSESSPTHAYLPCLLLHSLPLPITPHSLNKHLLWCRVYERIPLTQCVARYCCQERSHLVNGCFTHKVYGIKTKLIELNGTVILEWRSSIFLSFSSFYYMISRYTFQRIRLSRTTLSPSEQRIRRERHRGRRFAGH